MSRASVHIKRVFFVIAILLVCQTPFARADQFEFVRADADEILYFVLKEPLKEGDIDASAGRWFPERHAVDQTLYFDPHGTRLCAISKSRLTGPNAIPKDRLLNAARPPRSYHADLSCSDPMPWVIGSGLTVDDGYLYLTSFTQIQEGRVGRRRFLINHPIFYEIPIRADRVKVYVEKRIRALSENRKRLMKHLWTGVFGISSAGDLTDDIHFLIDWRSGDMEPSDPNHKIMAAQYAFMRNILFFQEVSFYVVPDGQWWQLFLTASPENAVPTVGDMIDAVRELDQAGNGNPLAGPSFFSGDNPFQNPDSTDNAQPSDDVQKIQAYAAGWMYRSWEIMRALTDGDVDYESFERYINEDAFDEVRNLAPEHGKIAAYAESLADYFVSQYSEARAIDADFKVVPSEMRHIVNNLFNPILRLNENELKQYVLSPAFFKDMSLEQLGRFSSVQAGAYAHQSRTRIINALEEIISEPQLERLYKRITSDARIDRSFAPVSDALVRIHAIAGGALEETNYVPRILSVLRYRVLTHVRDALHVLGVHNDAQKDFIRDYLNVDRLLKIVFGQEFISLATLGGAPYKWVWDNRDKQEQPDRNRLLSIPARELDDLIEFLTDENRRPRVTPRTLAMPQDLASFEDANYSDVIRAGLQQIDWLLFVYRRLADQTTRANAPLDRETFEFRYTDGPIRLKRMREHLVIAQEKNLRPFEHMKSGKDILAPPVPGDRNWRRIELDYPRVERCPEQVGEIDFDSRLCVTWTHGAYVKRLDRDDEPITDIARSPVGFPGRTASLRVEELDAESPEYKAVLGGIRNDNFGLDVDAESQFDEAQIEWWTRTYTRDHSRQAGRGFRVTDTPHLLRPPPYTIPEMLARQPHGLPIVIKAASRSFSADALKIADVAQYFVIYQVIGQPDLVMRDALHGHYKMLTGFAVETRDLKAADEAAARAVYRGRFQRFLYPEIFLHQDGHHDRQTNLRGLMEQFVSGFPGVFANEISMNDRPSDADVFHFFKTAFHRMNAARWLPFHHNHVWHKNDKVAVNMAGLVFVFDVRKGLIYRSDNFDRMGSRLVPAPVAASQLRRHDESALRLSGDKSFEPFYHLPFGLKQGYFPARGQGFTNWFRGRREIDSSLNSESRAHNSSVSPRDLFGGHRAFFDVIGEGASLLWNEFGNLASRVWHGRTLGIRVMNQSMTAPFLEARQVTGEGRYRDISLERRDIEFDIMGRHEGNPQKDKIRLDNIWRFPETRSLPQIKMFLTWPYDLPAVNAYHTDHDLKFGIFANMTGVEQTYRSVALLHQPNIELSWSAGGDYLMIHAPMAPDIHHMDDEQLYMPARSYLALIPMNVIQAHPHLLTLVPMFSDGGRDPFDWSTRYDDRTTGDLRRMNNIMHMPYGRYNPRVLAGAVGFESAAFTYTVPPQWAYWSRVNDYSRQYLMIADDLRADFVADIRDESSGATVRKRKVFRLGPSLKGKSLSGESLDLHWVNVIDAMAISGGGR